MTDAARGAGDRRSIATGERNGGLGCDRTDTAGIRVTFDPIESFPVRMSESIGSAGGRRAWLGAEFERQRPYLRAVAYRMLGSVVEADDALQECWLRLDRRGPEDAPSLRPWLTAVLGRICIDMLRARRSRREDYAGSWLPEPVVAPEGSPEDESVLADSVGLALLVVLETLSPAERLAFVLHDVFAVPFEQIAPVVGRSSTAARQLASRARRRVQAARAEPDADVEIQRAMVDAFLRAARAGDFAGLLALLDPEVELRTDGGGRGALARSPVTGAEAVATVISTRAPMFAPLGRPVRVNGGPGFVIGPPGRPFAVVALTVAGGRIRAIDIVGDPDKLRRTGRL